MASPLDYTNLSSPRPSSSSDEGLSATLLNEKLYSFRTDRKWTPKRKVVVALGGALFLVILGAIAYGIVGVFVSLHLVPTTKTHAEFGDCGSTIDEAKAKGCIFDNLSYAWVQPPCSYSDPPPPSHPYLNLTNVTGFHGALLDSFRARSNISYYSASTYAPEDQIPQQDIYDGKWTNAFADKEQHPVHCAFMLSKMHEALLHHLPVDNAVMEFDHTIHCGQVLMQNWLHEIQDCNEGKCEKARVNMKFTTCGYW